MDNYAKQRIERLSSITDAEQPLKVRKTLSVAENGKRYRVDIGHGMESIVYPIDGKAIIKGPRCDKFAAAISKGKGVPIFIELKGKDIKHAVDQLESTICHKLFMPYPQKSDKARARIISANSGPSSASRVYFEKAKIRFKTTYNVDLKQLKGMGKDSPIE